MEIRTGKAHAPGFRTKLTVNDLVHNDVVVQAALREHIKLIEHSKKVEQQQHTRDK